MDDYPEDDVDMLLGMQSDCEREEEQYDYGEEYPACESVPVTEPSITQDTSNHPVHESPFEAEQDPANHDASDYDCDYPPKLVYRNRRMRPYSTDHRSLMVQAGMGMGKSKEESNYVKELAKIHGDKIIFVKYAHRVSYASQEATRLTEETGLPFETSESIIGDIDLKEHRFLLLQWESQHRLRRLWGIKGYILVILFDETNSIWRQAESSAGAPAEDLAMFNCLLKHSSYRLFMDACFTNHTIEACKAFILAAGHEVSHLLCGRGHQIPMSTNCNYIKRIKCSWSTLGIH
jgi:hypothetical protein